MDNWLIFWLFCVAFGLFVLIVAIIHRQNLEKKFRKGEMQLDLDNIRYKHRRHADWIIEHTKSCDCENPNDEDCLLPQRDYDKY